MARKSTERAQNMVEINGCEVWGRNCSEMWKAESCILCQVYLMHTLWMCVFSPKTQGCYLLESTRQKDQRLSYRSLKAGYFVSKCLSHITINSFLVQAKCVLLVLLILFWTQTAHWRMCDSQRLEILLQLEHTIQAWSKALCNFIFGGDWGGSVRKKYWEVFIRVGHQGDPIFEQDCRQSAGII